ncbi:uncharacterized protein PgNI_03101 [Pyricularia grisea]|uniref:Complex III subunit 9 n=1 Tax=Pyricularia grisea TaxID=148305 RepID=A0A6P8BEG0_PYRGI|nr:uncharacterized protein PgNI_03101 [Pyricularia grisea]TLD14087.1 hypothetical protein PgNI_03101 [Pyricularia grisea]
MAVKEVPPEGRNLPSVYVKMDLWQLGSSAVQGQRACSKSSRILDDERHHRKASGRRQYVSHGVSIFFFTIPTFSRCLLICFESLREGQETPTPLFRSFAPRTSADHLGLRIKFTAWCSQIFLVPAIDVLIAVYVPYLIRLQCLTDANVSIGDDARDVPVFACVSGDVQSVQQLAVVGSLFRQGPVGLFVDHFGAVDLDPEANLGRQLAGTRPRQDYGKLEVRLRQHRLEEFWVVDFVSLDGPVSPAELWTLNAASWEQDETWRLLFRRNAVMLGTVFTGAFIWEIGYNTQMNKLWDSMNRGRQWKDIRHKYVEASDDDE